LGGNVKGIITIKIFGNGAMQKNACNEIARVIEGT
jgi:hypothetical protein